MLRLDFPDNNSVWPEPKILDSKFSELVPGCEIFGLDNGMRVVLMRDGRDRSCKFEIYVNAGAIHQSSEKRGVSHFTEHMVFRGTDKLPDNVKVNDYAREYNISFNGRTGTDYQHYYTVADNDIESAEAAAFLLSEIVLHPTFPEKGVDLEKDIVLSERKAGLSDPNRVFGEAITNHFHSQDHPLGGGGIIGVEEDIVAFNHKDAVDFYSKHFTPQNMVLVVSGGLPMPSFRRIINKHFRASSNQNSWVKNPLIEAKRDTKINNTELDKPFNHISLATGKYFSEPSDLKYPDPEYHSMLVAADVMTVRLFLDVRERQGLAYHVHAGLNEVKHGHMFNLYGEFPTDKYEAGKEQLIKYLDDFEKNPITEDEFRRSIRRLRSVRWADNVKEIANYVASKIFFFGQPWSPELKQKYYDRLVLDEVNDAVKKLLADKPTEIIAVGPIKSA